MPFPSHAEYEILIYGLPQAYTGQIVSCTLRLYSTSALTARIWYDPQPHLENPDLAETSPHHYHEPPDIKHNRRPAHGLSFHTPNLAALITDCVKLGQTAGTQPKVG
jgi:hypothetical protein